MNGSHNRTPKLETLEPRLFLSGAAALAPLATAPAADAGVVLSPVDGRGGHAARAHIYAILDGRNVGVDVGLAGDIGLLDLVPELGGRRAGHRGQDGDAISLGHRRQRHPKPPKPPKPPKHTRSVTPPPPSPDSAPPPAGSYTPGTEVVSQAIAYGAGLQQLVVLGTDAADAITVSQTSGAMTVTTSSGAQTFAGAFSSLVIYNFSGDDTIRVTNTVTCGTAIYAGDGNDTVFAAGAGAAVVYGGAGDDLLVTVGGSAATVYGEDGLDTFWFDSQDKAADASSAESAATSVHKISSFYQPSNNPADYVSMEIAGQKIADPQTGYRYANFASLPLFADGPEYTDVGQGYLGDCYFLATLASLAQQDPGAIRQMIAPMGDGTFAVRYFRSGQPVYFRVDADLPTSGFRPIYADLSPENELWVALAEKAYAEFRYGENSYASIEGGWMSPVYREVTNASVSEAWTSSASASALAQFISVNLAAGHAITAGSWSDAFGPIVGSHAYMVKSIEISDSGTYVTVYNPWGVDGRAWDSNPNDGLLRISMDLFRKNFAAVSMSLA